MKRPGWVVTYCHAERTPALDRGQGRPFCSRIDAPQCRETGVFLRGAQSRPTNGASRAALRAGSRVAPSISVFEQRPRRVPDFGAAKGSDHEETCTPLDARRGLLGFRGPGRSPGSAPRRRVFLVLLRIVVVRFLVVRFGRRRIEHLVLLRRRIDLFGTATALGAAPHAVAWQ